MIRKKRDIYPKKKQQQQQNWKEKILLLQSSVCTGEKKERKKNYTEHNNNNNKMNQHNYLVTGDIGGTNSRIYMYDATDTEIDTSNVNDNDTTTTTTSTKYNNSNNTNTNTNTNTKYTRTPIAYYIYRNSDYFSTTTSTTTTLTKDNDNDNEINNDIEHTKNGLLFAERILKHFFLFAFDNNNNNNNNTTNNTNNTNNNTNNNTKESTTTTTTNNIINNNGEQGTLNDNTTTKNNNNNWYRNSTNKKQFHKNCTIYITLAVAGIVNTTTNTVVLTNLNNLYINGTAIATYYNDKSLDTNNNNNNNNTNNENYYLSKIKQCTIINDFVAQGYGCLTLTDNDVIHLYGQPSKISDLPIGPKVCIGAGTGLGECYLTPNTTTITTATSDSDTTNATTTSYTCYPSEGGHVDYSPKTILEYEMFQYMCNKFHQQNDNNDDSTIGLIPRISVERVVSGVGLSNIYDFLADKYMNSTNTTTSTDTTTTTTNNNTTTTNNTNIMFDPIFHQQYTNELLDNRGKIIAMNYTSNPLCQLAMDIMMSAYGTEVSNCCIKFIPTGGIFVTGGLTPQNIHHIINTTSTNSTNDDTNNRNNTHFMKSYLNKGRLTPILETIPCFAVQTADTLGIRGVLYVAIENYYNSLNGGTTAGTSNTIPDEEHGCEF